MTTGTRPLFSDDVKRDIGLHREKTITGDTNWLITINGKRTQVGFSSSVVSTIKMGIDIITEVVESLKDEFSKTGIKINRAEELELKKLLRSIT